MRRSSVPTLSYPRLPGVPPVSVTRFPGAQLASHARHAHDFLVLTYFDRGGGSLALDGREHTIAAGDAFVIAPGVTVGPAGLGEASGWGAFFPPDVVETGAPGAFLSWRAHPLLFPFVRPEAGGALHLRVPAEQQPAWGERFRALYTEVRERRDGSNEAVLAHLTLLLVAASRLAADVTGALRLKDEPLLAAVFGVIEARFAESLTLADVARAVSLTPPHLTTTVARKTGRTVQQWIAERRLAEARRLLTTTDLNVAAVGAAAGYPDASYFIKVFRRAHGVTPRQWRDA
jgi:AraC family transcriptional activator of pobA